MKNQHSSPLCPILTIGMFLERRDNLKLQYLYKDQIHHYLCNNNWGFLNLSFTGARPVNLNQFQEILLTINSQRINLKKNRKLRKSYKYNNFKF